MNINFRKIASVIASTVMIGSTIGLAAAASYPAPFVQSGTPDVAIVYGSNPAATVDLAAVLNVYSDLQGELAKTGTGSTSSTTTVTGGDFVKLQRGSDLFNLGEAMNAFYSTLDNEELTTVLASGTYSNLDNNDYDYDQKITPGALNLTFFQDENNDDQPIVGFDISDSTTILNYTLDFTDAVDGGTSWANLAQTELTLLGRTYYIAKAEKSSTYDGPKLTLMDTANSAMLIEGQASTVSSGSQELSITPTIIGAGSSTTSDYAVFDVDGVTTKKLYEGDVFKVGNNTYLAVKNVYYSSKDTGISKVDISLGSGKIVLENTQEVLINNEAVNDITDPSSSLVATITNSSMDLNRITLTWTSNDDMVLIPGSDLVFPGFETIKLSMAGFNLPAKEMTKVTYESDDKMKLSTTIKDGDLNLYFLGSNATNFNVIGKDATHRLMTNSSSNPAFALNESLNSQFVVTWISGDEAETYAFEINGIESDSGKNKTTLSNLVSGGKDITFTEVGDTADIGQITLTLNYSNDANKTANVRASSTGGSGVVFGDRIVTKEGLTVILPVNISVENTTNPTTWTMRFTEEDSSNAIQSGKNFSIVLGLTAADGPEVSTVTAGSSLVPVESGSDDLVGYVGSPLATKITHYTGGDQDRVDIEYHGDESFADVVIAESGAVVSSTGEVISSGGVTSLGEITVKDTEVSSVASKNLVVIGGSCVNSVAADLLGGAVCGADFTAKTGVGSDQFLIQTFAGKTAGKVSTLVAGYNAGDTVNAAKYLTTQTVDTTVGKKYKGTSATSAQLVTTA